MEEKPDGGPYHDEVDRLGGDHAATIHFFGLALSEGIEKVSLPAKPQPWPWKDVADMKSRRETVGKAKAKRSI